MLPAAKLRVGLGPQGHLLRQPHAQRDGQRPPDAGVLQVGLHERGRGGGRCGEWGLVSGGIGGGRGRDPCQRWEETLEGGGGRWTDEGGRPAGRREGVLVLPLRDGTK